MRGGAHPWFSPEWGAEVLVGVAAVQASVGLGLMLLSAGALGTEGGHGAGAGFGAGRVLAWLAGDSAAGEWDRDEDEDEAYARAYGAAYTQQRRPGTAMRGGAGPTPRVVRTIASPTDAVGTPGTPAATAKAAGAPHHGRTPAVLVVDGQGEDDGWDGASTPGFSGRAGGGAGWGGSGAADLNQALYLTYLVGILVAPAVAVLQAADAIPSLGTRASAGGHRDAMRTGSTAMAVAHAGAGIALLRARAALRRGPRAKLLAAHGLAGASAVGLGLLL